MNRPFWMKVGIALTLAVRGADSSIAQTASAHQSSLKGKTAAEAYQNIQILKEVPANQLIPAMQFITYSLGVECS